MGSQAIFKVPGATTSLASFLARRIHDTDLGKYQIVVTSNKPDCVIVIGEADIPKTQFKADMAHLAAQYSCVSQGDLDAYAAEQQVKMREASASKFEGTVTWATGMKP